jgi:hypothetical protein
LPLVCGEICGEHLLFFLRCTFLKFSDYSNGVLAVLAYVGDVRACPAPSLLFVCDSDGSWERPRQKGEELLPGYKSGQAVASMK